MTLAVAHGASTSHGVVTAACRVDDPAADLPGDGCARSRIDVGHRDPAAGLGQPAGQVGADVAGALDDDVGAGQLESSTLDRAASMPAKTPRAVHGDGSSWSQDTSPATLPITARSSTEVPMSTPGM